MLRESNQLRVRRVGLTSFGTAEVENASAYTIKEIRLSGGIRTEFEHLSRQLDVPAVEMKGLGSAKLASTRSSVGAFGGVGTDLYSNSSSLYLSEYEMRSTRS